MNKKLYISDNNNIGQRCKQWAKINLPDGFEIVNNINDCDIFISILYNKILSKEFLKNKKCYNFHPAILPNYAGVGTMTWSILNKEKFHGITLHKIDNGVDTGDIIDTIKFKIDDDETSHSLYEKTMKKMLGFFKNNLYIILNENYTAIKQDFSDRKVYTYKDLDELLNLTNYLKATHFPKKPSPYYYNKNGEKKVISYE